MSVSLEAPGTTRVTGSDGVEVAVHRWGVPGDLPPVFLQHGFVADTPTNWQLTGIVPALLAAGREVVGVDARGHGRSDTPHDPARYGETRMAEDLQRVADALGAPLRLVPGDHLGAVAAAPFATALVAFLGAP
jgi:pimeloyl-ACP methyl ester carboxylesterase